ncbi:MAG: hypothetical protein K1X51_12435 [Rhodospirillaceae bacterium]|nr:hypothetical protein [Rhodospirillaceae bacterium]
MLKLLFTIGLVYVVWFSFKNWARIQSAYKEVQDEKARQAGAHVKPKSRQPVVQDLVPCPKCGAYVAAGTACSCEKA